MKCRARLLIKALLVVAGIAVLGWMVMALWNAVMPALFVGSRSIDYLHALGLLVLSRILFGGFRGFRGRHGPGGCHGRHWRKWEAMTPEEREQFQQATRSRRRQRNGEGDGESA